MTAQEVIDLARVPLNDTNKDRYKDADLLRFLNAGLSQLKRGRADLFLGTLATGYTALTLASTLPTPEHVNQSIADYVTARASTIDNEDSERVAAFFTLAGGKL
ncbi:MAG: hypothetical protein ACK5A0_15355 [Polaromonas sp.]|jgi:hypothetical protein